jgi:hypothetical protein
VNNQLFVGPFNFSPYFVGYDAPNGHPNYAELRCLHVPSSLLLNVLEFNAREVPALYFSYVAEWQKQYHGLPSQSVVADFLFMVVPYLELNVKFKTPYGRYGLHLRVLFYAKERS